MIVHACSGIPAGCIFFHAAGPDRTGQFPALSNSGRVLYFFYQAYDGF